jgi:MFS family permease
VIPFALSNRVGIDIAETQRWISVLLAVYGGALLAGSPFCGWFADWSPNRRLPLLIGLVALAGATVMLCLGRSVGVLVAGRVFQGLAAAVVWTVGLALLVDTVGPKDIGQVMGYVSMAMTISVVLGPVLGGIVYERAGYYPVYYMAFALVFLDILMRLFLVEKKVAKQWIKEPELSEQASIAAAEQTSASELDKSTAITLVPQSEGGVITTKTANCETAPSTFQKSKLPPILTLLASRRLLAALWGSVVQATVLTAFDTVLALRVQYLFGWDSLGAGLLFLALVIPNLTAPLIGILSDRFGPRWLSAAGFLLTCPILTVMRFVDHDGLQQKVLLCALLALIGVTLTIVITPLIAEITYVVAAKEERRPGLYGEKGAYAQAYALFNVAWAAGTLIGPILSGFVNDSAGWGTMCWVLGLLSAISAIPTVIWTGGVITKRHDAGSRWGKKGQAESENSQHI